MWMKSLFSNPLQICKFHGIFELIFIKLSQHPHVACSDLHPWASQLRIFRDGIKYADNNMIMRVAVPLCRRRASLTYSMMPCDFSGGSASQKLCESSTISRHSWWWEWSSAFRRGQPKTQVFNQNFRHVSTRTMKGFRYNRMYPYIRETFDHNGLVSALIIGRHEKKGSSWMG